METKTKPLTMDELLEAVNDAGLTKEQVTLTLKLGHSNVAQKIIEMKIQLATRQGDEAKAAADTKIQQLMGERNKLAEAALATIAEEAD